MTIEFSLRRRATRARYMAFGWLTLATLILVGTYISLPLIADSTMAAIHTIVTESPARASTTVSVAESNAPHVELYSIGLLALSLLAVLFASFLDRSCRFRRIEVGGTGRRVC